MATEAERASRRRWLATGLAGLAQLAPLAGPGGGALAMLSPFKAGATAAGHTGAPRAGQRHPAAAGTAATAASHWVAAWNEGPEHRIGLLAPGPQGWRIASSTAVPNRAHGLQVLPDGSVLAVARRPGDWLLRWQPLARGRAPQVRWAEPQRQFNGHAVLHPDGRHLLLTETDTEADDGLGRGLVVLRDLATLQVRHEWPSGGRDPHQLLVSPDGRQLWVANGGIASRPESGRTRLADVAMDASLARFDRVDGLNLAASGRWQVDDPQLSLRHLAWHAPSRTLGVAMQSEHPDPAQRQSAPVLALWHAERLQTVPPPTAGMAGYAGDIVATPAGFMLSSPRAHGLSAWSAAGGWLAGWNLAAACALASDSDGTVLVAGQGCSSRVVPAMSDGADALDPALAASPVANAASAAPSAHLTLATQALPCTPDNHWVRWSRHV